MSLRSKWIGTAVGIIVLATAALVRSIPLAIIGALAVAVCI